MIPIIQPDPASFRDPKGRIYSSQDRIFRAVYPVALKDFEFVRRTGLINQFITGKKLLEEIVCKQHFLQEQDPEISFVLEHPKLPFISYPYEWPFAMLKSAALFYLEIHLQALENQATLTDASAYNIQFLGPRPIYIDHLSFSRYESGSVWTGYQQFCEQFLNPLLLQSYAKINYNPWYRSSIDGISSAMLRQVLPIYYKLFPKVFLHVLLQAKFQQSAKNSEAAKLLPKVNFPLESFKKLLLNLKKWIESLQSNLNPTVWQNYSQNHHNFASKQKIVQEFVNYIKPNLIYDLGCNTGEFSEWAIKSGAQLVIGLDNDVGALDQAFQTAKYKNLNFQPLQIDLTNPSPAQGWMGEERKSIFSRAKADGLLALAVIHHLALSKNIPLEKIIIWLLNLAPRGLVEFVPKADPKVQEMLSLRPDIFPNYNFENFLKLLSQKAKIIKTFQLENTERVIIWYEQY